MIVEISSLENIRNLRKQKLSELLFPCLGSLQERLIYGGIVHTFIENNEIIGYYINKNSEILDFYIKKGFDYLADDCFSKVLEELQYPVINIRSDDSLLINLVFNYAIDLEKGGYLLARDKRQVLSEINDPTLVFAPISSDLIEECWKILAEDSFYGREASQKDMLKNAINKDIFFCLIENSKVTGLGFHQAVRNNCSEIGIIIQRDYKDKGYKKLLLSEMAKLVEKNNYKCFTEVSRFDNTDRQLMEELGFYVIAKYFTANIKGKIQDNNTKKRFRRYSLTGLFKVL